jgi:hypothetical protein
MSSAHRDTETGNSKPEARNPKQYQNSNVQNNKLDSKGSSNFGFWSFRFVSDLEIRISDFWALCLGSNFLK